MIQVKVCPSCHNTVKAQQLNHHQKVCFNLSNNTNGRSIQKRNSSSMVDCVRTIDVGMSECFGKLDKLVKIVVYQFKDRLLSRFINEKFKIMVNMINAAPKIMISVISEVDESRFADIRRFAQRQIQSYTVVPIKFLSDQKKYIHQLQGQYSLEITQSSVVMLSKKQKQLQKLNNLYNSLIQLKEQKDSKWRTFDLQVIQFGEGKQKQIEDAIKSVSVLMVNPEQIKIKVKNTEKKTFVFISGAQDQVKACCQHIKYVIASNQVSSSSLSFRIEEDELKILEREKIIEKYRQKYGIKYEIKNCPAPYSVKINQYSSAYLLYGPSIIVFPKTAVIIVDQQLLKQIKQIQQSVHFLKDYMFFTPSEQVSVRQSFSQFLSLYVETQTQIGLILPQTAKQQFLNQILHITKSTKLQITLYFLQRKNQSLAIQALKNSLTKSKKWYVILNQKQVEYPKQVNQRIQQALQVGQSKIILTHEDLGIKKVTHTYMHEEGLIVHVDSGMQNFVQCQGGKMIAFIGYGTYNAEVHKGKPNEITLAVLQLDLTNKTQTSLTSSKTHKIGYNLIESEHIKQLQQERPKYEITLSYPDTDSIYKIWKEIKSQLFKKKITKIISCEGIGKDKLEDIINWGKLHNIKINIFDNNVVAVGFSQGNIGNLEKLVEMHRRRLLAAPAEYPEFWVKEQMEDVQIYSVDAASAEFKQVQAAFKVSKIKKLQRIQNKILFDKYIGQKIFLMEQNQGTIRQLKMFHGTRTNAPQLIYNDREESFNINYANMGSYGKGIYFAKNSQYSHNYHYASKEGKQMFYCIVLAGNSQIYNGTQTHNTSYRIKQKRIRYESVVNGIAEQILVVFKNRRAYPLYLITY